MEENVAENEYKISFYDIYTEYCKQCSSNYNYVVSKKYFEHYIEENYI